MSSQKKSSKDVPRLAVCWPACDAETVHVTFARSNWETPGIALQRQPNGEFMCIMGATDTFDQLLFKFIINGTEWKINPTIPMILDEYGYENNHWTPSEATAYHDACVQRLRRRITMAHVDQVELCRLALSIHGQTDNDGRQLECVVDAAAPDTGNGASLELSMSGLFNEIVVLRFQPLEGQPDAEGQLELVKNDKGSGVPKMDDKVNETGKSDRHEVFVKTQDMVGHVNDVWVAKFPADFLPHWLDGCRSNSERERRMESECATMRFLNEHTGIPAPRVYAYDVRYASLPDSTPESITNRSNPDTKDPVIENKVGWPFILMEKFGTWTLLPYWGLSGDPKDNDPLLFEKNKFRAAIWSQLATYQIELAKHPLAACGYLTLDCFQWQGKKETNTRKPRTPKSAFGIRPCIYDACMPFTNSIVSAFGESSLFQPARAFNSLNSVTARFQHFLTHGKVDSRIHFATLWQLRALIYDIFGASYENGPFILQHPDLSLQNIFISANEDGDLAISGLIDWEDAQVVPAQVAACPPLICLGRLRYEDGDEPPQWSTLFKTPLFSESVLLRHQHEYRTSIIDSENHMANEGHEPVIWKGFGGTMTRLSQTLREEMVLPVYVLEELCSGSLYKPLTGNVAIKYFPLIYHKVKGYEWQEVKTAACSKGAMRLALEDWEEKQKKKASSELVMQQT